MDLATILGILVSFGLILWALVIGGNPIIFLNLPSALIVLGGTFGATLINYPWRNVFGVFQVLRNAFFSRQHDPVQIIDAFLGYAQRARREGILAIEPLIKNIEDDYLRKGLQLTVDGLEPQVIQEIMETEIAYLEERHDRGAEVLTMMGTFAPAMGLIGTVIGLVQMLRSMNDPSTIGPAMAVALLTTFYGVILANLVFNPMAGKLRARSREEVLVREMILEGLLAISKGENPRILQEKMNSFIAPKMRSR